jgi:uncharacterized protein DUF6782
MAWLGVRADAAPVRTRFHRTPDPTAPNGHAPGRTLSVPPSLLPNLHGDELLDAASAVQELAGNRAMGALLGIGGPVVQRDGPTHDQPIPLPTGGGGQDAPGATEPPLPTDAGGKAMFGALRGSSIGRKALAIAAVYQVALEFTDNGAPGGKIAGYAPSVNRCYLKRTMDPGQLAAYFVHEMLHAQRFKQGNSPVAEESPDRADYVERMVEEETTATALSFEARFEADPTGVFGSGPLADAYAQYKRVRNDWKARHLKDDPGDAAGAEALAKSKGRAIVRWQIRGNPGDDGSTRLPMLGPEEHRSYWIFYRDEWNRAHGPGKTKAPEGDKRTEADAPAELDGGASAVAAAEPATGEMGEEAAAATT